MSHSHHSDNHKDTNHITYKLSSVFYLYACAQLDYSPCQFALPPGRMLELCEYLTTILKLYKVI